MDERRIVLSKIQSALTNICREDFPEVCAYLGSLQEADSLQPYGIATTVLTMDQPGRLSQKGKK